MKRLGQRRPFSFVLFSSKFAVNWSLNITKDPITPQTLRYTPRVLHKWCLHNISVCQVLWKWTGIAVVARLSVNIRIIRQDAIRITISLPLFLVILSYSVVNIHRCSSKKQHIYIQLRHSTHKHTSFADPFYAIFLVGPILVGISSRLCDLFSDYFSHSSVLFYSFVNYQFHSYGSRFNSTG